MASHKRIQNEKEFEHWEELAQGGRKYWFDIQGKASGFARYVKTVDANEITLTFLQEIYNTQGQLIEVHIKFPIDEGHKKVNP
ncbi:hypothetical protein BH09BAC1_BH09BAC1_27300 [soil metagenome]